MQLGKVMLSKVWWCIVSLILTRVSSSNVALSTVPFSYVRLILPIVMFRLVVYYIGLYRQVWITLNKVRSCSV